MDDLLFLLKGGDIDNNNVEEEDAGNKNAIVQPTTVGKKSSLTAEKNKCKASSSPCIGITTDDWSKLRIINRITSRLEQNEILYPHQFHTCTILSAATKVLLNSFLTSPSNVPLSGKTDLATVGIVFENSGTKISGKGSAYCILTVGDLTTGPLIALFLFGDAYSKFNGVKRVKDGTVVAILSPDMLPPKNNSNNNSNTSLSFSIRDVSQLRVIGTAQDYGRCQGSYKSKQGGVFSEKKCKHYVDTRLGNFCSLHAKQRFMKQDSSNVTTKNNSKASYVQQMRIDRAAYSSAHSMQSQPRPPSFMKKMTKLESKTIGKYSSSTAPPNQILFPNKCAPSLRAPLHMSKIKTQPKTRIGSAKTTTSQRPNRGCSLQNILQGGVTNKSSSSRTETPKRKLLRTTGFDGDVFVPKPNSLLFQKNMTVSSSSRQSGSLCEQTAQKKVRVLEQQRQVALQKRDRMNRSDLRPPCSSSKTKNIKRGTMSNINNQGTNNNALFDSIHIKDAESIRSSSSKFEHQANAEIYAANRKKLIELQRRENHAGSKNKTSSVAAPAIVTEYLCATCKQSYTKKPSMCIGAGHTVKTRRTITRNHETVKEKRLKQHNNEDGMVLASGLHWSGWRGINE